jgi:hypothetical protein
MSEKAKCICPACGGEAEYNGAYSQDRDRRTWTFSVFCFVCHMEKEAQSRIDLLAGDQK